MFLLAAMAPEVLTAAPGQTMVQFFQHQIPVPGDNLSERFFRAVPGVFAKELGI